MRQYAGQQTTRSWTAGGSCEEFSSESIENKESKRVRLDPFLVNVTYFSGALIDGWCPYAVHRAVMIIFIDCFYSCWKRDRVLSEDEVDL